MPTLATRLEVWIGLNNYWNVKDRFVYHGYEATLITSSKKLQF
jgi:hypothetical protein